MAQDHKDVEFHIKEDGGFAIYKSFCRAAEMALIRALSTGETQTLDVVVWSEAGAAHFAGDDGVCQYREDPEASVFERIEINAKSIGRVA